MKKLFIASLLAIITVPMAHGAIPWWERPTICRLDPTNCYPNMTVGYDSGMWDADGNCWGLKYICPEALTNGKTDAVLMEKDDIATNRNISADFDTNVLNGDCFGVRKTASNGAQASLNGKYVNVWCNGILENPDEELQYGEITYGSAPNCKTLAEIGYVGILNGRCYGKYYDPSQYYIDCGAGSNELPNQLIVLNGADYLAPMDGAPATQAEADTLFDRMYSVSQTQRNNYGREE